MKVKQPALFTSEMITKLENMRGAREFCQRGSNSDNVFINEGGEDPNSTESGPSSAHSETPFKWRFAGVPMMTQY